MFSSEYIMKRSMLIELTKEQEDRLTSAEYKVMQWINEHEEKIPEYSINRIADESYTSPATVSRAIRKCGFLGIAELKYKISAKLNYVAEEKVVNEIFCRTLDECKESIESIEVDKILRIVRYIKFSEKIYLIARGTTALIAKDFELQLQLLGYNAYVISDAVILKMSKKIFKKNNLVIIFTMKNSTPELEITSRNAKEAGATVVTCCCIKGTSLEQHSDITICVGKKNNKIIEEYNISSRLPLQIISKTLTEYLIL